MEYVQGRQVEGERLRPCDRSFCSPGQPHLLRIMRLSRVFPTFHQITPAHDPGDAWRSIPPNRHALTRTWYELLIFCSASVSALTCLRDNHGGLNTETPKQHPGRSEQSPDSARLPPVARLPPHTTAHSCRANTTALTASQQPSPQECAPIYLPHAALLGTLGIPSRPCPFQCAMPPGCTCPHAPLHTEHIRCAPYRKQPCQPPRTAPDLRSQPAARRPKA